jgi:hypothetical protein
LDEGAIVLILGPPSFGETAQAIGITQTGDDLDVNPYQLGDRGVSRRETTKPSRQNGEN